MVAYQKEKSDMQLLQDVFIVENLQVLSEGKTNPTMKIKGIFGRCNEKNNNGRIYPTAVLEGQLSKVQPMINERRLCGELDHPQNDTVKLSNASHLITKLEMKGNELVGEAEILNTPAGLTAKALVEGGVKIGISSRGMGTLSEDANGQKIVNEDFRLVTFDLVADPSTRGAFPGLSESTESKFVRESQNKLQKESNFVTMIEARLRDSYTPFLEEAKKKKKEKKGGFPDLNKDGEITKADVLMGRGVIGKKKKMTMESVKEEGSWHKIAFALADAMGLDEDYTQSKKQRDDSFKASVRASERGPQGGKARRDREALLKQSTSYQRIGDLMAEALGLTEMRNKTHADQIATVDKSRKKAFQKAHKGEGRRSKAEINRAAMKRENQINRRQAKKD